MFDEHKLEKLREGIPFLKMGIYVDNAAVTPIPQRVRRAVDHFNEILENNLRDSKPIITANYDKGRALASKMVGSSASNIAYIQNTAHGLSLVALGVDWCPGDNLVVCAQEFPSNYLCWLQLSSLGVEVRQVTSPDGRLEPDLIRAAMDHRTRIVTVSHVQYYSGFRVDVAALADLCSEFDAMLVVDGTQSIGAINLDVGAAGVDVLVVSAHKWLMGPRGVGFASFSDRALERVTPRVVGWLSVNDPYAFNGKLDFLPDARRFEPGTPNGAGIYGLVERLLQIDEIGIGYIEDRILNLSELLCELALKRGLQSIYEFDRRSRSGITLIRRPGVAAVDVQSLLASNRIFASVRNNAIRIAPHYYNTTDEIEEVIAVMSS